MKSKFYFYIIFTGLTMMGIPNVQAASISSNTPASVDDHAAYFQALKKIQQLPSGSTPILPCSIEEKKYFLELFKTNGLNKAADGNDIQISNEGHLFDNYQEGVEIYKGDFSNQGYTEYMLNITGGSMNTNTTFFYKLDKNKLTKMDFDDVVISNLKLGDMAQFHLFTADPVAYIKDNKTYLRFMDISGDYDSSKLFLYTYLWQQDNFTLVDLDHSS